MEHCDLKYYEKMATEAWLMSPPCQPFTRGGLKQDDKDNRSTGFLYLLNILEQMRNPPKYLFLENVLNFEVSKCHERMIAVLTKLGYEIEEYLVEPTDPWIGIPNARLRYYLSAVRKESPKPYTGHIYRSFVEVHGPAPETIRMKTIGEYLLPEGDDPSFLVPQKYLTDYKNYRHDITKPSYTRSTTFTKSYGSKYIIGTGSFLQTKRLELEYANDDPEALVTVGLRFFTPLEIAKIHGLPIEESEGRRVFKFPEEVTRANQYRLLGNSLNIKVVSFIFRRLFSNQ